MAWFPTKRIIHEVEAKSNLDLILRGFNGAVNRFADIVGGGLQAIALALSAPQDNSTEVQRLVDQMTKQINASSDQVEEAIKTQKGT